MYGSEVFVKFIVNGPHPVVSEALKITRGVGYIVTSSVVVSVHPLLVVAINVIVYTIAVLVVFSGNIIVGSKSVGFIIWTLVLGVLLQL